MSISSVRRRQRRKSAKSKRAQRPNGYILWRDGHRAVIATGFARKSQNGKTGPMIQVWILPIRMHPMDAIASGHDSVICGDCKLGPGAPEGERVCYVEVGKAPSGIWKAYHRGMYPPLPSIALFRGRKVRWGAYGDPVHVPFPLMRAINIIAAGWTGYTHQWAQIALYGAYRAFLMASVDSHDERERARAMGWRTFRVASKIEHGAAEITCLNTTRGITCHDCGLCAGASKQAKDIVIEVHGFGKRRLAA